MSSDDSKGRWGWIAGILTGCCLLYVGWLAAIAVQPALRGAAPSWLGSIGDPGSLSSMTLGLLLAAGAFGALLAGRKPATLRPPSLLSVGFAAGAPPLELPAYPPCTGGAPPFWTAVSSTLALFLGSFDVPFGTSEACSYPIPLGLQLARLLAIGATLSGATSVLFAVSRSQLDRFGLIRSRSLTVFVDMDAAALPLLQRSASRRGRGGRTVLLTAGADEFAEPARLAGALVIATRAKDPLGLSEAMPWAKVTSCYLLSADPSTNRSRALELRRLLSGVPDDLRRAGRIRVVARIDDPWQADDWRKRFIGDPGFVFDAVSTFEATADLLVARLTDGPAPAHLLVTGDAPLVLGLCAELSQHGREARFLDGAAALPAVTVLDPDATELVADHRLRQTGFGRAPVPIGAADAAASLATVEEHLTRLGENEECAVVIASAGTRLGSRLALRHPDLLVYELAGEPGVNHVDESPVGRLHTFGLGLTDAEGSITDVWERAAQALHERYRRRFPTAPLSVPWSELPSELYRESNRRQLHSVLDSLAALGRTWAPTVPDPAGGAEDDSPATGTASERVAAGLVRFGLSEAELAEVAQREHESWAALFTRHGWRYGAERDTAGRRHPDLRPWAELDDDARLKTAAGVVDTLFALRALGYRAVRPDEAGGWTLFERIGEVTATRLDAPHEWWTEGGDELVGAPGDWLVTDGADSLRTVTDASFHAGHEHLTEDRWRRVGTVRARRAVPGEEVRTQEGRTVAGTDSWVASDADGHRWLVPDAQLRATYRPASQD